jgi:molybdopterin converting factor subunit 1
VVSAGTIKVRLFASFRDTAGASVLELQTAPGATVADLWAALVSTYPALARGTPSAAVNATFAPASTPVAAGDEVAFLPPVSGG